jgi:hypothetical protein
MQDPIVVIGKLTINQIGIIDITNKNIIQTLDFDIMVQMFLLSERKPCEE